MMPDFSDPEAAARWRRYFEKVDRLVAHAGEDGAGLRGDLEAHLADGYLAQDPTSSEVRRLETAMHRLGDPADYLRPLVADGLIGRATRRPGPVGIVRGLYHAVRLGSTRMVVGLVFGFGYLLVWVFFLVALLWPIWRGHAGLYRWPDGYLGFGILRDTGGAVDLLGWWTMPAMLAAACAMHLLLAKGLRRAWSSL